MFARRYPLSSASIFLTLIGLAPRASGSPPIASRIDASIDASTAEIRARAALTGSADLSLTTMDRLRSGDTVARFAQTHRGVPVIGRGATVELSATGHVLRTNVSIARHLPADVVPAIAAADASTIARRYTRVSPSSGDAHLVVWPTRDGASRLAYAVVPRVPHGLPTAPYVIVDAASGEVLAARDAVVFAGLVRSYEHNPVRTPNLGDFELPLAPTGNALSNPFLEATNCVDQKTVKPVSFFGLALKVHVCDLVQVALADGNGDFLHAPADEVGSAASKSDAFSEASIYFHASKAYAYFRTLQGDPEAQVTVDKPLKLVANLQIPSGLTSGDIASAGDPDKPLEPFQNAFFSPAGGGLGRIFQQLYGFDGGALWFGQGPNRDYAYDGDVVYHEFGHAVVDATIELGAWHIDARGAIDAPGAMNEGLADYFAAAIAGDPDIGEYAATDFGAGSPVIRTLANQDRCPTSLVGEVHYDSTVFSGALWEARTGLPEAARFEFDAAIYKALRESPPTPELGFDDLAERMLGVLATDQPAGATALESAMKARGILPSCERILSYGGAPVASPEKRFGFIAPGILAAGVKGIAPGIFQLEAKIPAGATRATVTFDVHEGGGSPTSLLGGETTPFAPVILSKIGAPITWTPASKPPHDADQKVSATGEKTRTATFELPAERTSDELFLQIANTGDDDGRYDNVAVAFEVPVAEAPLEPEPPKDDALTTTETGCGCTTPGRTGPGATLAAAGALGAIALTARRRRSRS
jgi:MYXO-CTERM domain-containing protein